MATETIRVTDQHLGATEITGEVIGRIDTSRGRRNLDFKPRWGVNTVVRLRSGAYVLITEALSVQYHTTDTECRISGGNLPGEECTREEMAEFLAEIGVLPGDAVSCNLCKPPYPEDLVAGEKIRYEVPRPSVHQCDTGRQVARKLVVPAKGPGRDMILPGPARALLDQCRAADPDFFEAPATVMRIS